MSGTGEETELPLSEAAQLTWLKRTTGACRCGCGTVTGWSRVTWLPEAVAPCPACFSCAGVSICAGSA